MQWSEDLPEEWDDAPSDPPRVTEGEVEMTWTEDGFVLTPTAAEGKLAIKATSLFSTVACKVGDDAADRGDGGDQPQPPEA